MIDYGSGKEDSPRGSASTLTSPCRPARRTRWSPTLPPGREGVRGRIVNNVRRHIDQQVEALYSFITSFTLRDMSQGLVTAPRSQAVISMDLERDDRGYEALPARYAHLHIILACWTTIFIVKVHIQIYISFFFYKIFNICWCVSKCIIIYLHMSLCAFTFQLYSPLLTSSKNVFLFL